MGIKSWTWGPRNNTGPPRPEDVLTRHGNRRGLSVTRTRLITRAGGWLQGLSATFQARRQFARPPRAWYFMAPLRVLLGGSAVGVVGLHVATAAGLVVAVRRALVPHPRDRLVFVVATPSVLRSETLPHRQYPPGCCGLTTDVVNPMNGELHT